MPYRDRWKIVKCTFSRWHNVAFSKRFLLYTNVGISIGLSMMGDTLEQSFERYKDQIDGWNRTRTVRMGISGLTVGFVCHYWYQYLDYYYPKRTLKTVVYKILLDQFICSPFYIGVFFLTMGLLEQNNWDEVKDEIRSKALTLYFAEWTVGPAAQLINFFFVAPQYRVLYDNFVSLGFDIYTSRVKYSKKPDGQTKISFNKALSLYNLYMNTKKSKAVFKE
ncbi:mpv17-like protein 2 [Drosophila grimshawi]|uniref:GH16716 n=1 Tax=Drosophila grimshawi TaxID=7222 RepID=B4J3B2_DROGR|nr:mpv17-like protein 2 [Drosophila grimshawi]EDV97211.1 GH16716 [Drosophila grimshawi]